MVREKEPDNLTCVGRSLNEVTSEETERMRDCFPSPFTNQASALCSQAGHLASYTRCTQAMKASTQASMQKTGPFTEWDAGQQEGDARVRAG